VTEDYRSESIDRAEGLEPCETCGHSAQLQTTDTARVCRWCFDLWLAEGQLAQAQAYLLESQEKYRHHAHAWELATGGHFGRMPWETAPLTGPVLEVQTRRAEYIVKLAAGRISTALGDRERAEEHFQAAGVAHARLVELVGGPGAQAALEGSQAEIDAIVGSGLAQAKGRAA
jgi:hypothetical protein